MKRSIPLSVLRLMVVIILGVRAQGQVLFVHDYGTGNIGTYTTSGTPLNPSLITGVQYDLAITLDTSGFLYVAGGNRVAKYTTSGVLVDRKSTRLNSSHIPL